MIILSNPSLRIGLPDVVFSMSGNPDRDRWDRDKSVSPSLNLDVVITPNNGAGYEFNEAILYRGEKSMPMLPAGALKDSVQTFRADTVCVPGVLADTFRISCLTDTLQLQSTRRKEGTNTLRPGLILYEFILWPDTEEWRQGYLIPFHRSEWGDVCELY